MSQPSSSINTAHIKIQMPFDCQTSNFLLMELVKVIGVPSPPSSTKLLLVDMGRHWHWPAHSGLPGIGLQIAYV